MNAVDWEAPEPDENWVDPDDPVDDEDFWDEDRWQEGRDDW